MNKEPSTNDSLSAAPVPLYKFSSFLGAKAILESGCIWTKSPLDFNDPFEVLPVFDEERKKLHFLSRKEYSRRLGIPSIGDIVESGGEENMPVESWVDLAALIHDPLFDRIHRRFRVLCFSRTPDPNLLWSHYADSHAGIALGFDFSKGGFPLGSIPEGIKVDYLRDRTGQTFPLDYYESNLREAVNPSPEGYTTTQGGLLITHADSDAVYRDCLVKVLSSKQEDWAYERETRFLYDLKQSKNNGLKNSAGHDAAFFGPEAVTEVIFGYKCPIAEIEELAPMIAARYPSAKLKYVDLHPYKYEVVVHTGNLLQILTSHRVRQEHSFRSRTRYSR